MSNAPDTAASQTVRSLSLRQAPQPAALLSLRQAPQPAALLSLRRAPQPAALESRRSFLKQVLAAPAFALGFSASAARIASGAPGDTNASGGRAPGDERETAKAQPFKISLSQWSLRRELQAGRLAPLDFAKAANGFGVDAVEYVSQFYPGKPGDKALLAELKRRAAGEGVASLLIRIEAGGNLAAPDARARQRAVDGYKRWVEAAAFLGCHSIRVPTAGSGSEDDQANWLSEGLRRLCEFSAPHGIDVLVENQGGLSSKGSWLSEVLNAVHHSRCGSLASFGGTPPEAGPKDERASVLRDLMPFARGVAATAYDFDARGDEKTINYPQMLKIVTDAGYHGYVGIQYVGDRLSEQAGIERTLALLGRVREQLRSLDHR